MKYLGYQSHSFNRIRNSHFTGHPVSWRRCSQTSDIYTDVDLVCLVSLFSVIHDAEGSSQPLWTPVASSVTGSTFRLTNTCESEQPGILPVGLENWLVTFIPLLFEALSSPREVSQRAASLPRATVHVSLARSLSIPVCKHPLPYTPFLNLF